MPISKKVILLIIVLNILTVLGLYAILEIFITDRFAAIEKNEILQDLSRADSSISERFKPIVVLNKDWANWDDSFNFVSDLNQDFINTNLVNETFTNSGIDMILFYDKDGQLVFSKISSILSKEETAKLAEAFLWLVSSLNKDIVTSVDIPKSGLVANNNEFLYISAHPIYPSVGSGEKNGALLMGHLVNSEDLLSIKESTKLEFSIKNISDSRTSYGTNEVILDPEQSKQIVGRTKITDFFGSESILLKVTSPRDIYIQGRTAIRYVLLTTVLISFVILVSALIFIELVLIKPLDKIVNEVALIKDNKDFTLRVHAEGQSEFRALSENINQLLDTLRESTGRLRRTNESLTQQSQELVQKSQELEKMNQFMVGREVRMAQLKQQIKELQQRLGEPENNNA